MIFLFGIILLLLSFQLLEYVFNNLEMPLRCSPSRQAYFPFMLFVSIIEMIFTKILSKNLLKIFFFLKNQLLFLSVSQSFNAFIRCQLLYIIYIDCSDAKRLYKLRYPSVCTSFHHLGANKFFCAVRSRNIRERT